MARVSLTGEKTEGYEPWKVTDKRFVAYIDIMGFKDMVARHSHESIYEMMKEINRVRTGLDDNPLIDEEIIRTTSYSDSIMIYSKNDSADSLVYFLMAVSVMSLSLFTNSIPHKGAIAFGVMTLDKENSIFFGQPLIDAYLLQEELSFYGVVIHGTAEKEIKAKREEGRDSLLNYPCQFKNGTANHLVLYPSFFDGGVEYDGLKNQIFESLDNLRYRTSGHLRRYIDNTEKYFRFAKEQRFNHMAKGVGSSVQS